jgi:hypothetical protein
MIRYILRSLNVMNLILGMALLIMVGYVLLPLTRTSLVPALPRQKPAVKAEEQIPAPKEPADTAADYVVIADRNPFHPERTIPVEKKTDEKPLPKPDFVLYGTLIDGDSRVAFMDDLKTPYTTPGRGKRQHIVSQGSSLSGYVLSEVHEDRVVMGRGDDKITVRIDELQHKRTGSAEVTAPAVSAPAAGRRPAPTPQIPRALRPAQQAQQPAAQQAQPYRQYQPEALRRSMRSIKQQPPRTTTLPAQPAQPDSDDDD